MTEYDFSPQAYERHLANMQRISRWVAQTEHHRSQFANAAALTTPASMESAQKASFTRRPPPPPLNLSPYPAPPYSASSSSSSEFGYANGPRSPGPMPPSMYRRPPTTAYAPRASPPHTPHSSSPRSPAFSNYGFPTYHIPPPSPFVQYPGMMPSYMFVSPTKLRKSSSRNKGSRSGHRRVCSFFSVS
jgi:hypothetical protein